MLSLTVYQLTTIGGVDAVRREEFNRFNLGHIGLRLALIRINRAFRGSADRKLEALDIAVAKLNGPHDRVDATQRLYRAAEGNDVA